MLLIHAIWVIWVELREEERQKMYPNSLGSHLFTVGILSYKITVEHLRSREIKRLKSWAWPTPAVTDWDHHLVSISGGWESVQCFPKSQIKKMSQRLPGSTTLKTSPSSAGVEDLIPGLEADYIQALWPEKLKT